MDSPARPRHQASDAELVAAARAGDHAALAALVARHRPALEAACRAVATDAATAEDAAQEAVLQAIVRLDDLRDGAAFGPWLRAIGVNTCRYWARAGARGRWSWERVRAVVPEPADEGADPAGRADQLELAATVRRAVAALPAGQRAAVGLCYLAGLPLARAAAVLGADVGAVKTRLHKARRTLRERLAPALPPERAPRRRWDRFVAGGLHGPDGSAALAWRWGSSRLEHFRLRVDAAALTAEVLAFLHDPTPARKLRPGVAELRLVAPETGPVLDAMLIDGVVAERQVAAFVRAAFHAAGATGGRRRRSARLFRLEVDVDALAEAVHAFVADRRPRSRGRPVVAELQDAAPEMVPVLEAMVVDGVRDRRHVAAYVRHAVGELVA